MRDCCGVGVPDGVAVNDCGTGVTVASSAGVLVTIIAGAWVGDGTGVNVPVGIAAGSGVFVTTGSAACISRVVSTSGIGDGISDGGVDSLSEGISSSSVSISPLGSRGDIT